jgi:hypothetical protein
MITTAIVERLSLYLQTCGLEPSLAEQTAVEVAKMCQDQSAGDEQKLLDLAITHIQRLQESWLDHAMQTQSTKSLPKVGQAQLALAKYQMQRVINDKQCNITDQTQCQTHSPALLKHCYPATPPLKAVDMPRQSFGPLPGPIRLAFWKLLWRRFRQKLTHTEQPLTPQIEESNA